jgi:hypothetical protein
VLLSAVKKVDVSPDPKLMNPVDVRDWSVVRDSQHLTLRSITVEALSEVIMVTANVDSLISYPDLHAYVREPNWLFRLFADTLERRIERAKLKVLAAAQRRIERARYFESVARKTA